MPAFLEHLFKSASLNTCLLPTNSSVLACLLQRGGTQAPRHDLKRQNGVLYHMCSTAMGIQGRSRSRDQREQLFQGGSKVCLTEPWLATAPRAIWHKGGTKGSYSFLICSGPGRGSAEESLADLTCPWHQNAALCPACVLTPHFCSGRLEFCLCKALYVIERRA